jgi:hypothetical protein
MVSQNWLKHRPGGTKTTFTSSARSAVDMPEPGLSELAVSLSIPG